MNILIRKILRKANCVRKRYIGGYLLKNRIKLLHHFNINTIIDVGANTGQYAYYTRHLGYNNKIISFEPITSAFKVLEKFSEKDPLWQIYNYAIGDKDGSIDINISLNSQSSSILDIMPVHVESAPESIYDGKENVSIHKIDTIIGNIVEDLSTSFMKIDTQGFEKQVLSGANESLKKIKGLQIELSLVELYKDQSLFGEMINFIFENGFDIFSLEPGFYNPESGELYQVDGIFYRK